MFDGCDFVCLVGMARSATVKGYRNGSTILHLKFLTHVHDFFPWIINFLLAFMTYQERYSALVMALDSLIQKGSIVLSLHDLI